MYTTGCTGPEPWQNDQPRRLTPERRTTLQRPVADSTLNIGLNLLGLPTLRQGGAGLLAGMEFRELANRPETVLRVVANERVGSELHGDGAAISIAAGSEGPGPVASLRALALRDPMRQMADVAPAGAFDRCDAVHYPLSFMVAPRHESATVVTCVDLQHLHHPDFFSRRDRLLRALRWHPSVRRATRVAVFSEFVRGSVEERLGVPGERIDVVGACCSERFYEVSPEPPAPGRDFILYPASPLPAKNHGRLLDALALLKGAHSGLRLILVGPATHDWAPIRHRIDVLGLEDDVEIRGHVSLGELVDLYRSARATVFPSLFEGFGIPVLEAMAAGCPVAAADATSIPEVCGDAAILFDPEDVESIAEGIRRALEMPEVDRIALIEAARKRAALFRATAMVERQLASFERAAYTMRRS
jgi:glycosyltransferase involved in cell wall biosynthesis